MEPQHRTETPPEERTVGAAEAPAASRQSVGMLLREKRESFRQDLYTVAGQLHIRLSYLKAIEDGRFKDLPGLTYASGFVRSYSDYLGLDGEEMVRRFREEIAGTERQVQLIFPSLATEGKIPSGAILLLSGFLAVMAYGVWYYLADRQKSLLDLVPEVPAQLRALLGTQPPANTSASGNGETKPAGAAAVASGGPVVTHDAPVVAPPPAPPPPPATVVLVSPSDLAPLPSEITALIAAAEAAPAGSTAMSSTAGTAATSTPAPAAPAATTAASAGSAAAPVAPATTPAKPTGQVVVANPGARVKLMARMDSWVQIYDKAGKSYFSAVLRAGQTIEVPNLPGLLLTTGNIGGLDILIDGQALAALGSVGLVKRDLPLDVAGLKTASTATQ